jgi:periplasmic divalent cation tolerance protein
MMLVIATCPEKEAAGVARSLVEEKLVACVNLLARARSVYSWQGKVEEADETVLLMKTRDDLVDRLGRRLRELHPYDVPEMIALPFEKGLPDYLAWVNEVTRRGDSLSGQGSLEAREP